MNFRNKTLSNHLLIVHDMFDIVVHNFLIFQSSFEQNHRIFHVKLEDVLQDENLFLYKIPKQK